MRISTFFTGALGISLVSAAAYGQSYSLDATFGTAGKATVPAITALSYEAAKSLALQPDGRIVVAGQNSSGFGLARLTAAGQLDLTFGTAGIVSTPFIIPQALGPVTTVSSRAVTLLVQADGKIVAGGNVQTSGPGYHAYGRYLSTGALDNTFGTSGQLFFTTSLGGVARYAGLLRQQADGKLLTIGWRMGLSYSALPDINRVTAAGVEDNTYASTYPLTGNETSIISSGIFKLQNDAILDNAGRLLAAGVHYVGNQNYVGLQGPAIVRYLATGSYDPAFGTNGIAVLSGASGGPGQGVEWSKIVQQADGKILVASSQARTVGTTTVNDSILLARYLDNGTLDTSFGRQGLFRVGFGASNGGVCGFYVLPTGEFLLGVSNGSNLYLVRLAATGRPIASSLSTIQLPSVTVGGITLQPDGKVLVAGSRTDATGSNYFSVARLVYATQLSAASPVAGPQVQLYPNPAAQHTALHLAGVPASELLQIQVVDALGREVATYPAVRPVAGEVQLPLAEVRPGTYLLRIQGAGFALTRRFVRTE